MTPGGDIVNRVTALLGLILIAFGAGIGVGLMPASPAVHPTIFAAGVVALWIVVRVLTRTGDIWKFTDPHP